MEALYQQIEVYTANIILTYGQYQHYEGDARQIPVVV